MGVGRGFLPPGAYAALEALPSPVLASGGAQASAQSEQGGPQASMLYKAVSKGLGLSKSMH